MSSIGSGSSVRAVWEKTFKKHRTRTVAAHHVFSNLGSSAPSHSRHESELRPKRLCRAADPVLEQLPTTDNQLQYELGV